MKLRHLYISCGHNFFGHHGQPPGIHSAVEIPEIHCVASRGIRGDRFFDHKQNYKGQVTFFANEVYDDVCRALGIQGKSAAVLRRNILTEGADLNALVGTEFELQGVRFRGVEECAPCYWMNTALAPGAEKLMKGRGGLRAVILTDGCLCSKSK